MQWQNYALEAVGGMGATSWTDAGKGNETLVFIVSRSIHKVSTAKISRYLFLVPHVSVYYAAVQTATVLTPANGDFWTFSTSTYFPEDRAVQTAQDFYPYSAMALKEERRTRRAGGGTGSGTRQETAVAGKQVWAAQKKCRYLYNTSRESLTPQLCRGDLHTFYQGNGKKLHISLPCPEEASVYKYLRKCSASLVIKKKTTKPKPTN